MTQRLRLFLRWALERRLFTLALIFVFCLVWEALARLNVGGFFFWDFMVPPSKSLASFYGLLFHPPYPEYDLIYHSGMTLLRAGVALLGGIALAVPVGFALGWWKALDAVFTPLFEFLRPTPSLIFFPILILLFGTGSTSKIMASLIAVTFVMVINSLYGAKGTDTVLVNSLRTMGASNADILRKAVLYSALPHIASGIRVSIGASILVIVSTEMIQGRNGLGFVIYFALDRLQFDNMWAGILATLLVGAGTVYLWQYIEKKVLKWHFETTSRA